MKGDFSRQTANPQKHYTAVLMQQGRVQVDADWNEQLAVNQHRTETEAKDMIGPGGVPLEEGGFKIDFTPDSNDLTISPGRIYIDGILCELEATPFTPVGFPTAHSMQVPVWTVDGRGFQAGQWIEISGTIQGNQQTQLVQISTVDPANLILTFQADISAFQHAAAPSARHITTYTTQAYYPNPAYTTLSSTTNLPVLSLNLSPGTYDAVVYIDVWQRHITALDDPSIREVALGGPDTTTRVQTIWQVKLQPVALPANVYQELQQLINDYQSWLKQLQQDEQTLQQIEQGQAQGDPVQLGYQIAYEKQIADEYVTFFSEFLTNSVNCYSQFPEWDALVAPSTGALNARTQPVVSTSDPCLIPPSAGYQRLENQLYRVEIHNGSDASGGPTFKWSRDNGSVVAAIESITNNGIVVQSVGPDDILGFANVDGQLPWVEVVDDVTEFNGQPGQLVQIVNVDVPTRTITVSPTPSIQLSNNPKLRRWDQAGPTITQNGIAITPATWLDLEGGIQVQFSQGNYKTGDYWLIPARTVTGEIDWPQDSNTRPLPQLPLGVQHHYYRLGLLQQDPLTNTPSFSVSLDCRNLFPALGSSAIHILQTNWQNDDYFGTDRLFNEGLHVKFDTAPNSDVINFDIQSAIGAKMIVTLEEPLFVFGARAAGIHVPGSAEAQSSGAAQGAEEVPGSGAESEAGATPGSDEASGTGGSSKSGEAFLSGSGSTSAATASLDLTLVGYSYIYENSINWYWQSIDKPTLDQALLSIIASLNRPPYMRVRVKGHSIWRDQGSQRIYLDGQAFVKSDSGDVRADTRPRLALTFPSGAGIRASDFESWFYLVPPPLWVTKVNFIKVDASGNVTSSSAGPITFPPGGRPAVQLNVSDQVNAIDITFNRPVNMDPNQLPNQIKMFFTPQAAALEEIHIPGPAEAIPLLLRRRRVPPFGEIRDIPMGGGGGGPVQVQGGITKSENDIINTFMRFSITDPTNTPSNPGQFVLVVSGGDPFPDGSASTALTSLAITSAASQYILPGMQSISMNLDGNFDYQPGGNFVLPFNVVTSITPQPPTPGG